MKEITMLELRRDARRWLEAVRNGERFVLTYRGKPVARLEPVRSGASDIPEDDPLLSRRSGVSTRIVVPHRE